jgi:hypothetical protein
LRSADTSFGWGFGKPLVKLRYRPPHLVAWKTVWDATSLPSSAFADGQS